MVLQMSNSKTDEKKARSPLHHRYIMGILAGLIVALLSINWSKVTGLPEMLNMALALSSLILAGLAIVYSFHTNGSLSNTLEKIEESSQNIKTTSQKVEQSNQDLKEKVDSIPGAIYSVKETVDGYKNYLDDLILPFSTKESPEEDTTITISETDLRKIVENLPRGVKHLLFMFHTFSKKHLAIDYSSFSDDKALSFFHGYFLSTISLASNLDIIQPKWIKVDTKNELMTIEIINQAALYEANNFEPTENEKFIIDVMIKNHSNADGQKP